MTPFIAMAHNSRYIQSTSLLLICSIVINQCNAVNFKRICNTVFSRHFAVSLKKTTKSSFVLSFRQYFFTFENWTVLDKVIYFFAGYGILTFCLFFNWIKM